MAKTPANQFKQTEIGEIPRDWEVVPLGEYVTIRSGESPSLFRFNDSGIPYFKVEQLNTSEKYLRKSDYYICENKSVPKDSLIFPKRGASILLNKIRILSFNSYMDTNLMSLTTSTSLCHEFLFYYLLYFELWKIADTTSIPQINNKHIQPLQIPLPPLAEQQAIAAALSEADALLTALDEKIAKKRDIKQATMQLLLSGKKRVNGSSTTKWKNTEIGQVPEEWRVLSFEEAFVFLTSASYSRAQLSGSESIAYIHYGDIHTKFNHFIDFDYSVLPSVTEEQAKSYAPLKEGDLIIVDASEDYSGIGKAVEVKNLRNREAISGLHTFVLRSKDGIFCNGFKGYIRSNSDVRLQFERLASGLKVYGVSRANLKNILIPIPPLAEQTAIAEILSDMDAEIAVLEKLRTKQAAIKQGMMQELLTGRTRLV